MFRIVVVAAVAVLGYLLIKPFFDPPRDADTVSGATTTSTTVGDDGSFPDGSPPLTDAVLRLAELPPGWSTQAEIAGPGLGFCGGRSPGAAVIPVEVLRSTFSQGASGPFLSSIALRFTDDEDASLFMDLVVRTMDACQQYQDGASSVTLEPSDFPTFGDETFSAHVLGDNAELGAVEGQTVWVRKGTRVINVSSTAFGEVDVELIELITERLARRL